MFEGDERFSLALVNPSDRSEINALSSAVATISEDDPEPPAGELNWSVSTLTLEESAGSFELVINRENGSYGECLVTASVSHTTTDTNDLTNDDSVELVFAAGETSKSLSFTIVDDTDDEADESFNLVVISEPKCSVGTNNSLAVTITDNDESGSGSINWLFLATLLFFRNLTNCRKQK